MADSHHQGPPPWPGLIPPPPGVAPNLDHPASLKHSMVVANAICLTLACVSVALRLWTRAIIVRSLGWDDFFCVIALVLSIMSTVTGLQMAKYGLGMHAYEIRRESFNISAFIGWSVAGYMLYMAAMAAVKYSILLLYFRIFAVGSRLKYAIYVVIALVTGLLIGGELSYIFGCQPIAKLFNRSLPGRCINDQAQLLSVALINMATDFAIVALPLPVIWSLQFSQRQKLVITGIFGTGLLVCAISVRRVTTMVAPLGADFTWQVYDGVLWSEIEQLLAIFCACLPAFKPLLSRAIPWALRLTTKGSSNGPKSGPTPSNSRGSVKRIFHTPKSEDTRLVDGSYLELGENGTSETVVMTQREGGPRDPTAKRPSDTDADSWHGEGIMKTIGIKVAH